MTDGKRHVFRDSSTLTTKAPHATVTSSSCLVIAELQASAQNCAAIGNGLSSSGRKKGSSAGSVLFKFAARFAFLEQLQMARTSVLLVLAIGVGVGVGVGGGGGGGEGGGERTRVDATGPKHATFL